MATKRKHHKTTKTLVGEATQRLLRGIKAKHPVSSSELLRRGYPKRFVARFEAA